MGTKRGGRSEGGELALSFLLILRRAKFAEELFTGGHELDGVLRVGGGAEVGHVHDVVLAHAQHHQVGSDWLLFTYKDLQKCVSHFKVL